jgi:TonB-dependent starch-binding outer membrane protein SusC
MKTRVAFIVILSLLCVTTVTAQKKDKKLIITGRVLNSSGDPIRNAIILIDDKKTDVMTDAEGSYKIKVKPEAAKIAIFTFGNGTIEDSIKGRTVIDFNFSTSRDQKKVSDTDAPASEEGVNTGYGLVKKKNLTTDVTKVDAESKNYAHYHSVGEMIEREVSGVKVRGSVVYIQGSQNLQGEIPALIVVDGVPMESIPDIQPIAVKSVEVLKGTSAAIYGNRGYGGAIIIKTKTKL